MSLFSSARNALTALPVEGRMPGLRTRGRLAQLGAARS